VTSTSTATKSAAIFTTSEIATALGRSVFLALGHDQNCISLIKILRTEQIRDSRGARSTASRCISGCA
jgi:hypothetical protein